MWIVLSTLTYILGFALIILMIMQRKPPANTLAWTLAIVFLPVIGSLLYLWFGFGRVVYRIKRRSRSNKMIAMDLQKIEQALTSFLILQDDQTHMPVQRELVAVTAASGGFSATHGNAIILHTDANVAFDHLLAAILGAEESVHLQYYIFRKDETGREVRDALIAAAKRGVKVRLLIDGVGSWSLPWSFLRPLRRAGGFSARYLPVTPFGRPWHWNLRNHRKIAVIDGHIGFTGSANIGNEYRHRTGKISDFDDLQVECRGPVVQQLQEVFAADWFFATRENLFSINSLFPLPERSGTVMAQVVEGGPTGPAFTLHDMLCAAVHAATQSVRIVSPYLIPDQALIAALRTAALRGISVELIVARHFPGWEKMIHIAGRSFYEDLLPAGVKIYEYLPAFLHAKGVAIDGCFLSMGTANIDMRSFFLNFEVNMNIYSREISAHFEQMFAEHKHLCEEITREMLAKRSLPIRFLENTMRVFSPIL